METKELKDLIIWCKQNKVKTLSIDNVSFEISEIAFVDELEKKVEKSPNFVSDSSTLVDNEVMSKEEEDELLFWSTKG